MTNDKKLFYCPLNPKIKNDDFDTFHTTQKKDPLDEIFLQTDKEKQFWKELQDCKRKLEQTEFDRVSRLKENLELKNRLKELAKIEKMDNTLAYLEKIVIKLYRLTGHEKELD
jgi:hypothetical protein